MNTADLTVSGSSLEHSAVCQDPIPPAGIVALDINMWWGFRLPGPTRTHVMDMTHPVKQTVARCSELPDGTCGAEAPRR